MASISVEGSHMHTSIYTVYIYILYRYKISSQAWVCSFSNTTTSKCHTVTPVRISTAMRTFSRAVVSFLLYTKFSLGHRAIDRAAVWEQISLSHEGLKSRRNVLRLEECPWVGSLRSGGRLIPPDSSREWHLERGKETIWSSVLAPLNQNLKDTCLSRICKGLSTFPKRQWWAIFIFLYFEIKFSGSGWEPGWTFLCFFLFVSSCAFVTCQVDLTEPHYHAVPQFTFL